MPPDGPPRYLAPLALLREPPDKPVDLRVLFGYRGRDDGSPPNPGPGHPTAHRETLLAEAATVIRPPTASYQIRSVSTFEPGTVFSVHDGTTVGRAPDVGITFDHPVVSRHHAIFRLDGDTLTIEDLGSTNGTSLNGQPLEEGTTARVEPGDTIEFGSAELQYVVEEA